MHVTVPVTGRVLRIPVPDAVDPEQLRALIRITINGVAAKRARTHVFDDARYATAILTPRIRELEERGAAWEISSRDRANLERLLNLPPPERHVEKLAALIGVALRSGRGVELAEITNAFFAHEEASDACEVCEARRYGELARFAALTDTPPALVGDLWEACVAAGLVADVTSPRFEEQFHLAPQPLRNAPSDPDAF